MTQLELQAPSARLRLSFLKMLDDYKSAGERFRHGRIHQLANRDFDAYMRELEENSLGLGLQSGFVPYTMFWLVRDGVEVVGETTLRHYLVPSLRHEGGHIGYRIRPNARQQGCGSAILRLMLLEARDRGLPRVLVTCDTDNVGSGKIIRKNGGVLESEVISHHSGKPVSRYWIDLTMEAYAPDVRPVLPESNRVLDKVTAFITRRNELLLFKHPNAGIQLPAGTVELNESFSNAAWREVYEETGLTQLQLLQKLGRTTQELAPERRCLLRNELLTTRPAGRAVSFKLNRGNWVRQLRQFGAYTEVSYEEYNYDRTPPRLLKQQVGWMPDGNLATHAQRHYFQFACRQDTAQRWRRFADRHFYELFWAPLDDLPALVGPQQAWLDQFRNRLVVDHEHPTSG